MATTGTYNFGPAASNLTMIAFGRLGIRRPELSTQHLTDADLESNLLQVEISNRVPNLWAQEIYTITLTQGTTSYNLPTRTVGIRDCYLTLTSGGVSTDRMMDALSPYEYDAQANKTLQSVPTQYMVTKLTPIQTITVWPTADGNATYTLNIRLLRQLQDASQVNGATLDMPYRFLDVYVAGMALRLSRLYAKDQEQARKLDYVEAWTNAASQDVDENVNIFVSPQFDGYWR